MTHPDSPALKHQSEDYPPRFGGRVPSIIRMLSDVRADSGWCLVHPGDRNLIAGYGEMYDCWVNSHGAVAVVFPDGKQLGVRPHEFTVEEFSDQVAGCSKLGRPGFQIGWNAALDAAEKEIRRRIHEWDDPLKGTGVSGLDEAARAVEELKAK